MKLHCCGVENYTDWNGTDYFRENGVPVSCCRDNSKCSPESLKDMGKAEKEVYTTVSSHVFSLSSETFFLMEKSFMITPPPPPGCVGLLHTGDHCDGGQPGNYRRHLIWHRILPGTLYFVIE